MRLKSISKCCYKRFLCGGFKVTRRKCFMTEIIARRDFPPLYIHMDVAFFALFAGYAGVIIYNLFRKDNKARINIPWVLAIGVPVQFGWEAGPLLGGIRPAGFEGIAENQFVAGNESLYAVYLFHISRIQQQIHGGYAAARCSTASAGQQSFTAETQNDSAASLTVLRPNVCRRSVLPKNALNSRKNAACLCSLHKQEFSSRTLRHHADTTSDFCNKMCSEVNKNSNWVLTFRKNGI